MHVRFLGEFGLGDNEEVFCNSFFGDFGLLKHALILQLFFFGGELVGVSRRLQVRMPKPPEMKNRVDDGAHPALAARTVLSAIGVDMWTYVS